MKRPEPGGWAKVRLLPLAPALIIADKGDVSRELDHHAPNKGLAVHIPNATGPDRLRR
ncbi:MULTISPECIES: hypothetical protein [Amycolatopsis]|uniref:Uncharacterized protein n=1 Tax=Amycolatopsis thermalba TaxID=944492 RepID=A0ABY4NV89_9PSEU|nr:MULTISPECIES: hypothetical protein [Amycolatopsis]UQS23995.1 hypothetical protein L1857_14730 [Amycolatopsis thermalba]